MVGTDVRLALVTVPSRLVAEELCRTLIEERLVACGNIVHGVQSIYRWKGRIEDEPELLVVLKTVEAQVERLLGRIPEVHPYEVPEVLIVTIEAGYQPYLDWVLQETGAGD